MLKDPGEERLSLNDYFCESQCSHYVCGGQRQRKIGQMEKKAVLSQRLECCSVSQGSSRGCWHLVFSPVRTISDSGPPSCEIMNPVLVCTGGGGTTYCFFHSLFLLYPRLALSLACSRGQHWMPHPPAPVPESWDSRHVPLCWFMQYSGSNPGLPAHFARQAHFQLSYSSSLG